MMLHHRLRLGVLIALCVILTCSAQPYLPDDAAQLRPDARAAESAEREREAGDADWDAQETAPGEAPDLAWLRTRLQDEHGQIPADGLQAAQRHIARMRTSQSRTAGLGRALWKSLGPSNIGGRVRTMIIHPTIPTIMYAGAVRGGIWKTTDRGASWQPLDDFLPNLSVTAMVFDPANPDIIWAGGGEYVTGGGIYRSTDAGATWTVVPGTSTADFHYIRRITAVVDGAVTRVTVATITGIFQTIDAGAHWTRAGQSRFTATLYGIWDIEQHPTNPDFMVASSNYNGAAMWYSTDGGDSWTPADVDSPVSGRIELAYAPSNPSIVYASVEGGDGALFKSSDGGQHYALVNHHRKLTQGQHNNTLWVDPTNPDRLMFGGVDVYRSADGGLSFEQISDWSKAPKSAHADQHWMVSDPAFNGESNDVVYVTNDGGVYRMGDYRVASTTDGWEVLNNQLAITQLYGVAAEVTSGALIGGAQDNGNLRLTAWNTTNEWVEYAGGDGGFVAIDSHAPFLQYHEYVYLTFLGRRNPSTTADEFISGEYFVGTEQRWKDRPYHIPDAKNRTANFIAPFALDPNNATVMFAGGKSLWRTTDVTAPVTSVTGPAWYEVKPATGTNISAIAVAPQHSEVVWVGDNAGGLWRSTNATAAAAAVTWTDVAAALPDRAVTDLWIDPADPAHVFATFGGFSAGNVWATTDAGATWTSMSGSATTALPNLPVYTITVHPTNPAWVFAGTELGMFASADGGAHWSTISEGPSNAPVFDTTWMGNTLIIGTHGRGVFSIDMSAPTISSVSMAKTGSRTLRYTVVFSEPVFGVDAADFAVVKTRSVTAAIASVTGSGTTYAVDVSVSAGTGSAALGLAGAPSIRDAVDQVFVLPSRFVTQGCTVIPSGLACDNAVTTTADAGPGSLRQLIADLPAGATIVFAPSLSGQTISLTSQLEVSKALTIDASLSNAHITIDGGGTVTLFNNTAASLTLVGLHLVNGSGWEGGALWNAGTMVVRNSSITGSRTSSAGAALYNKGTVTLVNTTIFGNTATSGSVLYNAKDATMSLIHTTVGGNTAPWNVLENIGRLTLQNSILADASAKNCYSSKYYGTLVVTNSIIEDKSCASAIGGDPKLAPAALNGSTTYSMALKTGSIAINAANDRVCTAALVAGRDQRGAKRPAGARCDIGAYEANAVIPTATPLKLPTKTRTVTPLATSRTATRTPTRRVP